MNFSFVRPAFYSKWAGDIKALFDLQQGLRSLGHSAEITTDPVKALTADHIFFSSTAVDHTSSMYLMQLMKRDYGCIAFHEDHILFAGVSFGLYYYLTSILTGNQEHGLSFSLEDLCERPHLVYYFDRLRPMSALVNYEFLKGATDVIANSHTEKKTLLRDVPGCKARIVYWAAGHAGAVIAPPTDSFLRFTGLTRGEYILQVGRLSARKNQLTSLLATKDLDIPFVCIAMDVCNPAYEQLFFAAARKWRKSSVILISQHLAASDSQIGIQVIPTPNKAILSKEMLLSAFANAGLHLHPSFYELPGYTYLESARFGIPTIATEWCSLKDYFTDFATGQYGLDDRIEYVLPYDILAIRHLVKKKFGQKYPATPLHPIYRRTVEDVAQDFLAMTH